MAATVQIRRWLGASPGNGTQDITSINTRANTKDEHTTGDTTYPIQRPPSGTNYSYWVSTRLNCTVTPSGTINNLRWYTDGTNSYGTGVGCNVAKASTGADSGYRQATGTEGQTGTQLTQANHTGLDAAPVDAFTKTSGSPLSLNGSISNPNTGAFGDFVVYQVTVDNSASPGVHPSSTPETWTWKYDET